MVLFDERESLFSQRRKMITSQTFVEKNFAECKGNILAEF